jgi:hypothetical protein
MSEEKKIQHNIDGFDITEFSNKHIYIFNNVLNNEICENIINEMNSFEYKNNTINETNNVECYECINYDHSNIGIFLRDIVQRIFNAMKQLKKITILGDTGIQLRKVYGSTRKHVDGVCTDLIEHPTYNIKIKNVRILTLVGVLNDDYEGGIYNFPDQNIQIKLKSGSVLVFPPYFTHPHEVSSVIQNNVNNIKYRYIFSSWALDNFIYDIEFKKNEFSKINNIVIL